VLGDVEDGYDVRRSREPGGRERLAAEAGAGLVLLRVPVREDLDRHRALERGVGRAVHLAHSPSSDEVGRGVSPRKHVASDVDVLPVRDLCTPLSGGESRREGVVRVEREGMLARSERASLDLRHHRGIPATSASPTTRAVKAVPTMLRWSRSWPRGRRRERSRSASRADVPLPQGERSTLSVREDGHVPLDQRVLAFLLPEDDAVDVPQLRLDRVDDRPARPRARA
jgi:hypothetical protein